MTKSFRTKKDKAERTLKGIRNAKNTVVYMLRTAVLIVAGALVCAFAFFYGLRLSNLYILFSEGMTLRTECIVNAENDTEALRKYFLLSWLNRDAELNDGLYRNFDVTSFDESLSVRSISVWPWSTTAVIVADETVNVKGSYDAEKTAAAGGYKLTDPSYSRRVRVSFVNNAGRWYISSVEILKDAPAPERLRTPDPNMAPLPMATPTPTPTPAPDLPMSIEVGG